MKKRIWKNCIAGLLACLFLVAIYCLAQAIVGNELLLPSFGDCVSALGRLLADGVFWTSLAHTFLRVLIAFLICFVLAGGFSVLSYLLPAFRQFFAPIVSVLRSVPTLAVLLIILVWTRASVAPVVVAFMTLFPVLYAGFLTALMRTDKGLIEMSKVYGVPLKKRVFQLYLPAISPVAVREGASGFALALKLVASAEVLAGTAFGLGGLMQDAKIYLDMPLLFALVGVTCLLGILIETLAYLLAGRLERSCK